MSSRARSSYDSRRESDRRRRDSLEAPETRRPKSNMPLMVALIVVVVLIVVGVIAIGYSLMNGDKDKKDANGNQVASGQQAANSAGAEVRKTRDDAARIRAEAPAGEDGQRSADQDKRLAAAEEAKSKAEKQLAAQTSRAEIAEKEKAEVQGQLSEKEKLLEEKSQPSKLSYKRFKRDYPLSLKAAKLIVIVGLLVIAGFWLLNMHNAGWDFDDSNAKSGDHVYSGGAGQGFGKVQQYAGADGLMNTGDDEFVLLDNNGGAMTYSATANNGNGAYMVGSSYGDDTSGVLFENYYKRIGAE